MIRIIISLLVGTSLYADSEMYSAEESFLQANTLYHQQAYNQALEKYVAIPLKSSGVLYNIGNCYYHLGHMSHAILYWLRAQRIATSWNMLAYIDYNIDVAKTALGASSGKKLFNQIGTLIRYLIAVIPPMLLQLIMIMLLIMMLIFIIFQSRRYFIFVCLLMLVISGSALLGYWYYQEHHTIGIVVEKMVSVYSGPGPTYSEVAHLKEGDQVTIGNQEDTWYKITHNELHGWIPTHFVEII